MSDFYKTLKGMSQGIYKEKMSKFIAIAQPASSAEEAKALIKQLSALPEEIRIAARDYNPARIGSFCTELAGCFHRFYTACRIKGAEPGVLEARLFLADSVRKVLENALGIIGVSAPEKM